MSDRPQPDRSNWEHHSRTTADTGAETGTEPPAAIAASSEAEATVRLIAFSDAVVAIAITLLAIDLPTPVNRDHESFMVALHENTPEYLSFLISFTVIGIHWVHHHRLFQQVVRFSSRLVILNFGWLLMIVVTPFMTKLLGGDNLSLITFGMYSITQALQMTVFALMAWTLTNHRLFRVNAPATIGPASARGALISATAFAVSVPVYAVVGRWAFACWLVIPFLASRLLMKGARGGYSPNRLWWRPWPARGGGGND